MKGQAPLSKAEKIVVVLTAISAYTAGMAYFQVPSPYQLVVEPVRTVDKRLVHTPLPDLCTFRGVGLGLRAVPDSRSLNRHDANCSFQRDRDRLSLHAWRPGMPWSDSAEQAKYARELFAKQGQMVGRGDPVPVGSMGDEAKIVLDPEAHLASSVGPRRAAERPCYVPGLGKGRGGAQEHRPLEHGRTVTHVAAEGPLSGWVE